MKCSPVPQFPAGGTKIIFLQMNFGSYVKLAGRVGNVFFSDLSDFRNYV